MGGGGSCLEGWGLLCRHPVPTLGTLFLGRKLAALEAPLKAELSVSWSHLGAGYIHLTQRRMWA